jgi:hypothetical protein
MTERSHRLSLPLIQANQAQKHITHNEALLQLDILVQLVIDGFDAITPPTEPSEGQVYAIGAGAAGDWAGYAKGDLAAFVNRGWMRITPLRGWHGWSLSEGALRVWDGGAWALVATGGGGGAPAGGGGVPETVERIGVNAAPDANNRLAVSSDATLLSHEGASHRLKVNKASRSDTSAVLFQSNWSGRAEMGLAGGDGFSIKVSADGASWTEAITVEPETGRVGFGTTDPKRNVHVVGGMRFEPSAEPADPSAGDVYFDPTRKRLRCFNGTEWRNMH